MSIWSKIYNRINWKNYPSTETALNELNLNKMDAALDEIDTRVVELSGYSDRAKESEDNAKVSESNAKVSENNAMDSELKAKHYMEEAFSGTPEGYENLVHKVNGLGISNSVAETFALDSAKGGIIVNRVVGKSYKSKNLLNATLKGSTTTNGITCVENNGTYTLSGTNTNSGWTPFILGRNEISGFGGKQIKLVGAPSGSSNTSYRINVDFYNGDSYIGGGFDIGNGFVTTVPTNATAFRAVIYVYNNYAISGSVVFKPMITEDLSATYDSFETYGLFSSGSMGCVDLGTLNWSLTNDDGYKYWHTQITDIKKVPYNNSIFNGYSEKYAIKGRNDNIRAETFNTNMSLGLLSNSTTLACQNGSTIEKPSGYLAYDIEIGSTPSLYGLVVEEEEGKNLNKYGDAKNSKQAYLIYGTSTGSSGGMILKKGTYTVSYKRSAPTYLYASNVSSGSFIASGVTNTIYTFTLENDSLVNIWIYMTSEDITCSEIMLEEGAEATDYIPYQHKTVIIPLANPLASVGDLHNEIVLTDDGYELIERVGYLTINGTNASAYELSTRSDAPLGYYYKVTYNNMPLAKYALNVKANMIVSGNYTVVPEIISMFTDGTICLRNGGNSFCVNTSSATTVDALKTLLNANPITVVYELATPKTTKLSAEQAKAILSLVSYQGKTYIDTVDYAKATFDLNYGASDVSAVAIDGQRLGLRNQAIIEEKVASLQALILDVE